ncbi:AraC family transcriptional regulator [Caulobacter endophyticus]|uniref:AraC family transcriptional regulator n=1 Tax=Caulobacter endophyticus TaxID=2172652 RepID=UPI0024109CD0|nr:helix-turn-helix domain-containing protein [Caulobacter endophyticus]MDG2528153.1 helix-turn-helix domain-containing protein [Caulobacter endophyticus]
MMDWRPYFGWRTALLCVAILQCLLLAVALARSARNQVANRFLAAALIVIAGMLTPYAIGFAGAYDRFRWLTFAPFAVPLAFGPLLYGYAHALADGTSPSRIRGHLLPGVVQFAYFILCFMIPGDAKWSWYTGGHRAWIAPMFDVLGLVSLAAYAYAIGRVLKRQRMKLADHRSDDDRFSARWLGRVLAVLLAGLAAEAGFWLWALVVGGIDFFQETGMYLALAVVGVYLGVAGWRQAALPMPLIAELEPALLEPLSIAPQPARAPDWSTIAEQFAERTRQAGWWREPELSLARLSRLLGVNSGRLSRAINLGLGINFSNFVNGLRAEGVARALEAGADGDLLGLAFDMGFASKASFNRAFKARFGVSPSQFRRRVSDPAFPRADTEMRRAAL